MSKVIAVSVFLLALVFGSLARAEDQIWLQIESRPTLEDAEVRARAYAAIFRETTGFRLRSGWYAIVLGPYGVGEGAAKLTNLQRENLIPADSFIAYATDFGDQFWPVDGAAPAPDAPDVIATPDPDPAPDPALDPAAAELPDETSGEARASEGSLSDDDRKLLQTALQWFGLYAGGIDGSYGPGTRKSMAAWQDAQSQEPTGVLTTRQRAGLVNDYRAELASFGFAPLVDADAGIDVNLPLALVEFDRYEPPFAHFRAKGGSGLQIFLISQPGDQASLSGLYDILQSLKDVPLTGERSRGDTSFSIRGTSATTDTTAYAELNDGQIKGWMLISTPGNETRDARIVQSIEASFKSSGDQVLDPGLVAMSADAKTGMLSGLEVRKPKFSRSGFFVDAKGSVLTTTEAVTGCARITIERTQEATVTLSDTATGLALLTPATPLSPRAVAEFQPAPSRIGTEVALSGYSYEAKLPSAVLTFGLLEDITGLNGEPSVIRLSIDALPGDTGGPVLDGSGAVLGMLLPQVLQGSKQLPPQVFFAASATQVAATLASAGLTLLQSTAQGTLAPDDLTRTATGMTVLVSCWD